MESFFSDALRNWIQGQHPDADGPALTREWDEMLKESARGLSQLKGRLSPGAYSFFSTKYFHDGSVESLRVLDGQAAGGRRRRFPTSVEILVRHPERWHLYCLSYKRVEKILLHTPAPADFAFAEVDGSLFEWGYDRLSPGEGSAIRHEILFASGSTLQIDFGQLHQAMSREEGGEVRPKFRASNNGLERTREPPSTRRNGVRRV